MTSKEIAVRRIELSYILVFIAAVVGIVALTYPAQGWFHWVDDHWVAAFVREGKFANPLDPAFFTEGGRFKPMLYILRVGVYYNVFQDNIILWRVWFVAHNALWMTLLYAVLRRLGVGAWLAALALPLLLLYPAALAVTYRLGTVVGMRRWVAPSASRRIKCWEWSPGCSVAMEAFRR